MAPSRNRPLEPCLHPPVDARVTGAGQAHAYRIKPRPTQTCLANGSRGGTQQFALGCSEPHFQGIRRSSHRAPLDFAMRASDPSRRSSATAINAQHKRRGFS